MTRAQERRGEWLDSCLVCKEKLVGVVLVIQRTRPSSGRYRPLRQEASSWDQARGAENGGGQAIRTLGDGNYAERLGADGDPRSRSSIGPEAAGLLRKQFAAVPGIHARTEGRRTMTKFAIYVELRAKPEKGEEVAAFFVSGGENPRIDGAGRSILASGRDHADPVVGMTVAR